MDKINIKVKKLHPDAVIPTQNNPTDSGYDLFAIDDGQLDNEKRYIEYGTGIAIRLPPGFHVKLSPRGSNSKYDLLLCNSEGLVDTSYTGELKFRYKPLGSHYNKENLGVPKTYKKGDRIGQMYIEKITYAEFEEVEELEVTDRGAGAFGSTEEKANGNV